VAIVEKRVRNGKTSYRVRYRDPAGRQRSKSFARKTDAERWMIETESAKAKGSYVSPALGKTKFAELAERWWATCAHLRPTTKINYRGRLDRYILPVFGPMPVAAIDRMMVREWLATMPPATATGAVMVLKQLLDAAVDAGMLASNPAAGQRRPKIDAADKRFLTPAEIERLAQAIRAPYGTLIRFAAYSGLRRGELTGLKVGRLDLLGGKVHVVEQLTEVGGRFHAGLPKTTAGRRVVRIPRWLCEELGAYLADRPNGPNDLVFTMPMGGPLRAARFAPVIFHPAVRAAGLEPLRFHDLRHTAISLWIAQGTNVKVVQKQAGHETAAMTLDVYGGLYPDDVDELMERLQRAHTAAVVEAWPQRGPSVAQLPGLNY
jgi:integrase